LCCANRQWRPQGPDWILHTHSQALSHAQTLSLSLSLFLSLSLSRAVLRFLSCCRSHSEALSLSRSLSRSLTRSLSFSFFAPPPPPSLPPSLLLSFSLSVSLFCVDLPLSCSTITRAHTHTPGTGIFRGLLLRSPAWLHMHGTCVHVQYNSATTHTRIADMCTPTFKRALCSMKRVLYSIKRALYSTIVLPRTLVSQTCAHRRPT